MNLVDSKKGERIRFSKNPKRPRKCTLFTVRKDKHIYFGISKWNMKSDKYDKAEGVKQARERAYAATNAPANVDMYITDDGLMGKCRIRDAVFVIQHFRRFR